MKPNRKSGRKWGAFLASVGLLTVGLYTSAGATQVGTIDNGYPGDTEAQAQMLHELGLFQGTDQGFQLDKPMTRAQAAVMLVRLLGEEQTALSTPNSHPFTDVPPWADAYIGWLYQNGLTKGMSDTTYGSNRRVTCRQYSTFLTRASRSTDMYLVIPDTEIDACDAVGFVRGDAVSLSTRLLGMYDEKDDNTDGVSVAQRLREKGVFTVEQLKAAAWDVLPREYENANARRSTLRADGEWTISCILAGVPVLRGEQDNFNFLPEQELTQQIYCYSNQDDGYTLYRVDPETLATTELVHYPTDRSVDILGNAGDIDYLSVRNFDDDTSLLLAVTGTEAKPLEGFAPGYQTIYHANGSKELSPAHWMAFDTDKGIAVLDATGARVLSGTKGTVCALLNDCLITQEITPEQTTLFCWSLTGELENSLTVENQMTLPEESQSDTDYLDYWLETNAPQIRSQGKANTPEAGLIWGYAGLYRVQDGTLTPLTARSVQDCKIDPADDSIVAIVSEPNKRVSYHGGGIENPAGDAVVRIQPDGTETVLLSDTPAHGLTFDRISYANQGEVRVVYRFFMGMSDQWSYEYAIEDGRPRPLIHEMGNGFSGYSEEECAKEQARLDAIYVAES